MTQMASLRALAVFIMGSNIYIFSQGSGGGELWDSTVLCIIKGVPLHILYITRPPDLTPCGLETLALTTGSQGDQQISPMFPAPFC